MVEWFCSGKIYQKSNGTGHVCSGFFSSTATADESVTLKEVFESFQESVADEYSVDSRMVHIEQLYKV